MTGSPLPLPSGHLWPNGPLIRRCRKLLGWSLDDLRAASGVSERTVARWERGEKCSNRCRAGLLVAVQTALCDALGVRAPAAHEFWHDDCDDGPDSPSPEDPEAGPSVYVRLELHDNARASEVLSHLAKLGVIKRYRLISDRQESRQSVGDHLMRAVVEMPRTEAEALLASLRRGELAELGIRDAEILDGSEGASAATSSIEFRLLMHITSGLTMREAAREMGVAESAASACWQRLVDELGARSAAERVRRTMSSLTSPEQLVSSSTKEEVATALLRRWHEGDEEALGVLVMQNLDELLAHAKKHLKAVARQDMDPMDLVQSAVLAVLRHQGRLRLKQRAQFVSFVRRILNNLASDIRRIERRRPRQVPLEDVHTAVFDAMDILKTSDSESHSLIWALLVEKTSVRDLARRMSVDRRTIVRAKERAVTKLRRILDDLS